jgi:hypothetical protein
MDAFLGFEEERSWHRFSRNVQRDVEDKTHQVEIRK